MATVREQVVATVAWADALGMPLSAFAVWKWLVRQEVTTTNDQRPTTNEKIELGEAVKALDELVIEGKVGEKDGFYFLAGREELVEEHLVRVKWADEKWKELLRIAQWLRFVPFLRAVFASGSLAINNTKQESDLDIFLVTAAGRIFTARLFLVALLKLFGRYRSGIHVANHICANHYVTDSSLEIPFRSLYTAHLYATFIRMWSVDPEALEKFWKANTWIYEYFALPAGMLGTSNDMRRTLSEPQFVKAIRGAVEAVLKTPLGDWFEGVARKFELAHIAQNPLTKDPGSGHVVANDQMLAFHPHSPEEGLLTNFRGHAI